MVLEVVVGESVCNRVFGRSFRSGRFRSMWICLDSVGLRGLRGCRRGRACAAVSLAGLSGLGFWWICQDSVGLRGLQNFYMPFLTFSFVGR